MLDSFFFTFILIFSLLFYDVSLEVHILLLSCFVIVSFRFLTEFLSRCVHSLFLFLFRHALFFSIIVFGTYQSQSFSMLLSSFLLHWSVFLIVFSSSLLISFLCYSAIVYLDVFSVLFLIFRGLSVVSPTLCRTSLLLFVVNQSTFRSSLVLDFVGGRNFFVVCFAITPQSLWVSSFL